MNILIIGGTKFVGRHITQAAIDAGHKVTLFNRGKTNADLFPGAVKLFGDRDGGTDALKGKTWDAVIDVCGYFPRIVRQSAELLKDAVGLYVFVSTISVYADESQPGIDENSELGTIEDPSVEEITNKTYGPLKVLCEEEVKRFFPEKHFIPRPGFVVGPNDPTDRFTYWPHRYFEGGTMLAPAPAEQPMQFIDGRDLGEWIIRMTSEMKTGEYNATGPDYVLTLEKILADCAEVSKKKTEIVWVDEEFLKEREITARELPLWYAGEEYAGIMKVNVSRAIEAGLTFRPLPETIRDTIRWDSNRPISYEWRAGLSSEREAELLREWKRKQG